MGVEIRKNSIRLRFTFAGKARWPTLKTNGKILSPTPQNIAYAERIMDEIQQKIRFGIFVYEEYFPADHTTKSNVITLAQWLDEWLQLQRLEPSTHKGYQTAIRFWQKSIGEIPLTALTLRDCLAAIAHHKQLSGKTVNNYVDVLRLALQLAEYDKVIDSNPAKAIPRARYQRSSPDPFDKQEIDSILHNLENYEPEAVFNMAQFWFFSGLRTSELLGLRWHSIDFERKQAHIYETMVNAQRKARTKTHSERILLLNSRALEALTRQKALQLNPSAVWIDPRYNLPWATERAFRRSYWQPTLKRLGIRYRRPYNIRHSYATLMLMAGMTPAFCAKQMGHGVDVFLDVYARWMDTEQNTVEMNRLEQFFK